MSRTPYKADGKICAIFAIRWCPASPVTPVLYEENTFHEANISVILVCFFGRPITLPLHWFACRKKKEKRETVTDKRIPISVKAAD